MILSFTDHHHTQLIEVPPFMDDSNTLMALVLHGCKLARDLEASLPNITAHPHGRQLLFNSCEEIVGAFNRVNNAMSSPYNLPVLFRGSPPEPSLDLGIGEGGDSRSHGLVQPMGPLHVRRSLSGESNVPFYFRGPLLGTGMAMSESPPNQGLENLSLSSQAELEDLGAGFPGAHDMSMETFVGPGVVGSPPMAAAGEGSSSGRRPVSEPMVQRSTKKRKEGGTTTIRVPALRTGNTDIPPDDGYTWRKYGQKDILGCRYPRSYYRCTHKNYYGCEAKKQVQRLNKDPYTYEVNYCGDHTCQTSTTPLLIHSIPPNNPNPRREEDYLMASAGTQGASSSTSLVPPAASTQLGIWLSGGFDGGNPAMGEGVSSGGRNVGGSSRAGGRDGDCSVADLADVMFNSGSSGSSIDVIFSSKHENWRKKED